MTTKNVPYQILYKTDLGDWSWVDNIYSKDASEALQKFIKKNPKAAQKLTGRQIKATYPNLETKIMEIKSRKPSKGMYDSLGLQSYPENLHEFLVDAYGNHLLSYSGDAVSEGKPGLYVPSDKLVKFIEFLKKY